MTISNKRRRRIAILGGGISGLAATYHLARARQTGAPIEEFLIEASTRLGGVIRTERVEGFVVEAGPDSFLTVKPEAAALCRELGLADSLLGSNDTERRTYILHRGRLVPLPAGLMLTVPTRLWPALASPLLPFRSKLAIAAEWFTSPPRDSERRPDETVASFVRRHFGDAMLENIVSPLLAGVYGGDSECLSMQSVLPGFWEMERRYGSLTRAVAKERRERRRREVARAHPAWAGPGRATDAPQAQLDLSSTATDSPPLFMTMRDGMGQLIESLSTFLGTSRVYLARRVLGIESGPPEPGGSTASSALTYKVRCEGGINYEADAIIFALPSHECSRLLSSFDPNLGETLRAIPYNSSMTVSLGYDVGTSGQIPPGFGFLVPRKEKRRLLACTFVHAKFRHRAPERKSLLRCFLGGSHDPEVLNFEDDEIVRIVREELRETLNFFAEPLFTRVYRWPSSMAQYLLGHADRLSAIQTHLEKHPGLFLAGNAYSGIGISDCIRTGRAAAEEALKNMC